MLVGVAGMLTVDLGPSLTLVRALGRYQSRRFVAIMEAIME